MSEPLVLRHPAETAKVVMFVLGGGAALLAINLNLSRSIIRMLRPGVHGKGRAR